MRLYQLPIKICVVRVFKVAEKKGGGLNTK